MHVVSVCIYIHRSSRHGLRRWDSGPRFFKKLPNMTTWCKIGSKEDTHVQKCQSQNRLVPNPEELGFKVAYFFFWLGPCLNGCFKPYIQRQCLGSKLKADQSIQSRGTTLETKLPSLEHMSRPKFLTLAYQTPFETGMFKRVGLHMRADGRILLSCSLLQRKVKNSRI